MYIRSVELGSASLLLKGKARFGFHPVFGRPCRSDGRHAVVSGVRAPPFQVGVQSPVSVHEAGRPGSGGLGMPYIDINPHRRRPRWLAYVVLGILAAACAVVVFLALTAG